MEKEKQKAKIEHLINWYHGNFSMDLRVAVQTWEVYSYVTFEKFIKVSKGITFPRKI